MLPPPYSTGGILLAYGPLVAGPLLAGWSRQPPEVIWPFALLFLLLMTWLRRPDLRAGEGWAQFAVLAVVQVALCWALIGLGRLAGVILPLSLPVWLPLAVTAAAAGFAMLRYRHDDSIDRVLGEAVDTLERLEGTRPLPDPVRRFLGDAAHATACKARQVDPLARRLEAEMGPAAIPALLPEMGRDGRVDFAVMRLLAARVMRRDPAYGPAVARLLEAGLASREPAARAEAGRIVEDMLERGEDPEGLPDPSRLRWLASGDTALEALARRMEEVPAMQRDAGE